jgi:hypothetical protein
MDILLRKKNRTSYKRRKSQVNNLSSIPEGFCFETNGIKALSRVYYYD